MTLDRSTNEPLPSRPDTLWATRVTWKHEHLSWQTSLHGQSRSRAQATVGATEGFRLVDTHLAWAEGQLRYTLKLTNLGNANYQQVAGYNGPGRSVLAGAEYRF